VRSPRIDDVDAGEVLFQRSPRRASPVGASPRRWRTVPAHLHAVAATRLRDPPNTVVLCELYAVSGPSSPPPSRLFLKFESGLMDAVSPPFCNWTQYFCANGFAVCVTVETPSQWVVIVS
jgi:hypothetical protein